MEIAAKYVGLTYGPDSVKVMFKGMSLFFRHWRQMVFCRLIMIRVVLARPN